MLDASAFWKPILEAQSEAAALEGAHAADLYNLHPGLTRECVLALWRVTRPKERQSVPQHVLRRGYRR